MEDMEDILTKITERRGIIAELEKFNDQCKVKFIELQRIKTRIVDDVIGYLVININNMVPDIMDPTDLREVLMRLQRTVETPLRKFHDFLMVHREYVEKLKESITDLYGLAEKKWLYKVTICKEKEQRLQEQYSEFLGAVSEAERILFLEKSY